MSFMLACSSALAKCGGVDQPEEGSCVTLSGWYVKRAILRLSSSRNHALASPGRTFCT